MRRAAWRRDDGQHPAEASAGGVSEPGAAAADYGPHGRCQVLFLQLDDGRLPRDGSMGLCPLVFAVRGGHSRTPAPGTRALATHRPKLRSAAERIARTVGRARRASRATAPRHRERTVRAGRRPSRSNQRDGVNMDLSLLPDGGVGWLDASGPSSDIVLSTRIRLARNIDGYAFTARARDGERLRILSQVREAVAAIASLRGAVTYRVDELAPTDRALLHERHLVSKELAGLDPAHPLRSGAAVVLGDRLGLMVNEEDHLRLQALRSGFAVNEAFADLDRLDRELGAHVPYSYHGEFGFLTACPTNVGTGMRASVLIHLPGLNLTKEISRVLTSLQQMGLTYRGLYGEGSEVVGNFLQISNQTTLGRTEEDLLDLLLRVVRHVVEREEEARRGLFGGHQCI